MNGFYFEEGRPTVLDAVAADFPDVPRDTLEQVLMRKAD